MITTFTRLALVLGLGILPLAAKPHGKEAGPGKAQGIVRMAEQLKLTESQKTQILAIQARHTDPAKVQAAAEVHKAFREAMQNPATTDAQLKALHQAKTEQDFERMLDRRARHKEIQAILTPEQRVEMDKLQAYHKGLKKGRGGHHKGA
jgi:Spy/CpxP family protein refolding chaperone